MDQLEDQLVLEQEKLKMMTDEVESTFVELSGYWFSSAHWVARYPDTCKVIFSIFIEIYLTFWPLNSNQIILIYEEKITKIITNLPTM